jgi:gas vesicle protein
MFNIEEGKKTAVNVLIGTAIGGMTGFIVGVLFAPKSGKETRKQMGDWIEQKRQQSADLLTRLNTEAKHKKEQVEAVLQASRHAYEETAHR